MVWKRRHREKVIFLMVAGAIGIVLLVVGGYQLVEFSDSTGFCGRLCHEVMYPEYTAYQASPHSRVLCADCHVGSGADYLVRSKISGIPLIITTITGTYDRPIPTPVRNLRPARETCEQCHRPERFSGDLVRTHTTYQQNEDNTPSTDTRILRVGGGESGVATGIHWHVAANLYYLSVDEQRQEIAWVGVETPDGGLKEYIDPEKFAGVTQEQIDKNKRLMDCVDCHNRATHIFRSPEELIDTAMTQGKIDASLPFIKREGMAALGEPNSSLEEADSKVEAIRGFYEQNYPDIAAEKSDQINLAVAALEDVARLTTFPDMHVTWNTYVNNAQHMTSPGCFRCHGTLVEKGGNATIDNDCRLCHYFSL